MTWNYGDPFGDGYPPNDGTGIPLPVDANGWPVAPGGGGTAVPTSVMATPDPMTFPEGTATLSLNVKITDVAVTQTFWDALGSADVYNGATLLASGLPTDGRTNGTVDVSTLAAGVYDLTVNYVSTDPRYQSSSGTAHISVHLAAADAGYDPAEHTVAEVQAYLAENPDQSGYVLDRERAGKARTTLIGD